MSAARLQAAGFVRRFRDAAGKFREFPDDGHIFLYKRGKDFNGSPSKIIEGIRTADKLKEVCGIWLIDAYKLGLVPAEQTDLVRLIEEHANPYPKGEPLPQGGFGRRNRCPYNLFLDLHAGGIVVGQIIERNYRKTLEPIGDAPQGHAWSNPGQFVTCVDGKPVEVSTDRLRRYRETGGLIETALPGAVQLRPMERCAEACEWLADLFDQYLITEHHVQSEKKSEGEKLDDKPDGPFDTDGFRFAGVEVKFRTAAKRHRLVLALWDAKSKRPVKPRPIEDVISDVYGEDNDVTDAAFRQLCRDTRLDFERVDFPLSIRQMNGKVHLFPL